MVIVIVNFNAKRPWTQPYYLAFINHGSEMIMQVKIQNLFFLTRPRSLTQDFPGGSDNKASACNAGDLGSIPGLGRSSGGGNGNPLQYFCLENPIDRGAWQAIVHGVTRAELNLETKPPPLGHILHVTTEESQ